jgi:hypothetical protein
LTLVSPRDAERHIRIALCDLPTMVDDILSVLVRDVPNVEIVARISRSADIGTDFERSDADLVICAIADEEMETLWQDALKRRPPLAFLNLGTDSARGDIYAVHPVHRRLDELTARSLLQAVQDHVR